MDAAIKKDEGAGNVLMGILAAIWMGRPGSWPPDTSAMEQGRRVFSVRGRLGLCGGSHARRGIRGRRRGPFRPPRFFCRPGHGGFYLIAHLIQPTGPDVAHATGDYGTRMFATAGMLNLLTVLEAYEIGRGRRD